MRTIMSIVALAAIVIGGLIALSSLVDEPQRFATVSETIFGVGIALGGTLLYLGTKIDALREDIQTNTKAIVRFHETTATFANKQLARTPNQPTSERMPPGSG